MEEIKKFQKGDKVRVTRTGPIPPEIEDWAALAKLKEGEEYTVCEYKTVHNKCTVVTIEEDRDKLLIHPNHFSKVGPSTQELFMSYIDQRIADKTSQWEEYKKLEEAEELVDMKLAHNTMAGTCIDVRYALEDVKREYLKLNGL